MVPSLSRSRSRSVHPHDTHMSGRGVVVATATSRPRRLHILTLCGHPAACDGYLASPPRYPSLVRAGGDASGIGWPDYGHFALWLNLRTSTVRIRTIDQCRGGTLALSSSAFSSALWIASGTRCSCSQRSAHHDGGHPIRGGGGRGLSSASSAAQDAARRLFAAVRPDRAGALA